MKNRVPRFFVSNYSANIESVYGINKIVSTSPARRSIYYRLFARLKIIFCAIKKSYWFCTTRGFVQVNKSEECIVLLHYCRIRASTVRCDKYNHLYPKNRWQINDTFATVLFFEIFRSSEWFFLRSYHVLYLL